MSLRKRSPIVVGMMALVLLVGSALVDTAEARRGGSFGSRGARTYSSPSATTTAPSTVSPIQRSMTPQNQPGPAYSAPSAAPAGRGFFGGFGGSLLGGLALGGLIGIIFGHGFGGMAGGFGFIFQIALLAFGAMFLFRYFANRNQPSMATGGRGPTPAPEPSFHQGFGGIAGFGARPAAKPVSAINAKDEIGISQSDLDAFERLLYDVQGAFGREDYAALREHTTPEVMSYLAEELSDNATHGLRNDVTEVKLLQGDLSEAWSEGDTDYATVAMRYESRDSMRKRDAVEADPTVTALSETTEIWTFARKQGVPWKLSAIQEV
jgi:predicted lipid-binding transport protein (Tim44 family)